MSRPKVYLEGIKFNHNSASATHDALNIRKNASQNVSSEWQRGISVKAEDSPAVYALKETRGNTLSIKAKFSCDDSNINQIQVRALDPIGPHPPPGPIKVSPTNILMTLYYQVTYWIISTICAPRLSTVGTNILGNAFRKKAVTVTGGQSKYVTLELNKPRLRDVGVGIHYIKWQWQYSLDGNTWTPMENRHSYHKIYTILAVPQRNWLQQAQSDQEKTQLPWTDVLDYACHWAKGTHTFDQSAGCITTSIYDLGHTFNANNERILEYEGNLPNYTISEFNCTLFLDRLRGGTGRGKKVSCVDMAAMVAIFANILGCNLAESTMGEYANGQWTLFSINPVLPVGLTQWQSGQWSYHALAWTGKYSWNDTIFDACIMVSNDPSLPRQTPVLPVKMLFGQAGTGNFFDRLVAPKDRHIPKPVPGYGLSQRKVI